jgi:hypothetical protein
MAANYRVAEALWRTRAPVFVGTNLCTSFPARILSTVVKLWRAAKNDDCAIFASVSPFLCELRTLPSDLRPYRSRVW